DIGVGRGRHGREGRTLFVHYGLEARQVRWAGHADRAVLVGGHQALDLYGHQTCQTLALVRRNEAAYRFGWDIAAAQVAVIVVDIVAAGVGGIGLPVVRGPAVASGAIEGEQRRDTGIAGIKIDPIDVGRNGLGFGGIDGNGDVHGRVNGGGAGLIGIAALAGGVHGGYNVVVGCSVCQAGVGEIRGCGSADLRVPAASGGGALEVIVRCAGTGVPSQIHLRIAGRGL